jgi:4-hydroxymandelate oxidase
MANLETTMHRLVPAGEQGSGMSRYVGSLWDDSLGWQDLDWLASITSLPIVPKGILHPEDALMAVDHGAEALIVSNHGGRQLDSAIAALDALPGVVEAVGDRAEVLIDGGIRRGTDVLKALALGARATLIGRPVLWGLAVGGEAGATHVLNLLRAELELDLRLCGLKSVEDVPRSLLV